MKNSVRFLSDNRSGVNRGDSSGSLVNLLRPSLIQRTLLFRHADIISPFLLLLSDPGPIIVYPHQQLTASLTDELVEN